VVCRSTPPPLFSRFGRLIIFIPRVNLLPNSTSPLHVTTSEMLFHFSPKPSPCPGSQFTNFPRPASPILPQASPGGPSCINTVATIPDCHRRLSSPVLLAPESGLSMVLSSSCPLTLKRRMSGSPFQDPLSSSHSYLTHVSPHLRLRSFSDDPGSTGKTPPERSAYSTHLFLLACFLSTEALPPSPPAHPVEHGRVWRSWISSPFRRSCTAPIVAFFSFTPLRLSSFRQPVPIYFKMQTSTLRPSRLLLAFNFLSHIG